MLPLTHFCSFPFRLVLGKLVPCSGANGLTVFPNRPVTGCPNGLVAGFPNVLGDEFPNKPFDGFPKGL